MNPTSHPCQNYQQLPWLCQQIDVSIILRSRFTRGRMILISHKSDSRISIIHPSIQPSICNANSKAYMKYFQTIFQAYFFSQLLSITWFSFFEINFWSWCCNLGHLFCTSNKLQQTIERDRETNKENTQECYNSYPTSQILNNIETN